MTREEAGKRAAIMQSYAGGKEVQIKRGKSWIDLQDPDFNGRGDVQYRIKPEPRRFWVWQCGGGFEAVLKLPGTEYTYAIEAVEVLK